MSESALEMFVVVVEEADAVAVERCVQILSYRDFTQDSKGMGGLG